MKWCEISIQTSHEAVELIAEIFRDLGASGVVIEDPELVNDYITSGKWDYTDIPIAKETEVVVEKAYLPVNGELEGRIQTLQQDIEVQERQIENLEQFIQRVRKYEDLDELTPYALRELVKAIYIEAPDKSSGKRHQGIRISYDLVGFIPVEELLKQETA